MTPRRLKGLKAITDTATEPEPVPVIPFVTIDGFPRTGLTITEVAKMTRLSPRRLRDEIKAGRLAYIPGCTAYIIPVNQLAVINSWAQRQHSTA